MKMVLVQIIAVAGIFLNSTASFALGGGLPPSNDYSGRPQCLWYDHGWDEDGGDQTKEQCLSHHGQCVQKCFIYKTVCSGSGVDHVGTKVSLSSQSVNSWEARAKIYEQCNARGLSSCMVTDCSEQSQLL